MQKNNEDIFKEIQKNQKYFLSMENDIHKELGFIKNFMRNLERKVSRILDKIEELEVVMEVSEIEDEEDTENYETEWNPYYDQIDGEDYDEENEGEGFN